MLQPLPDPAVDGQVLADMAHFGRVLTTRSFGAPYAEQTPAQLIDSYLRHNREVVEGVPADRLLVYDVTEGWEPLCDFLGVPVPDRPVPSFNDMQAFRELFGLDRTPEPVRDSKEQVEGHFREALPTRSPLRRGPAAARPQTTESGSSVWPVGPIWISVPISGQTPQS